MARQRQVPESSECVGVLETGYVRLGKL